MANTPIPAPPPRDPIAAVAGLRTLGTGAQQAAAGNDPRIPTGPTSPEIDSVVALRASNIHTTNNVIYLKGHTSPGDGGEGFLFWDPSNVYLDNTGTVIKPTSVGGAGRWLRSTNEEINVKQFGAKGDGVTDDAPAIQAALDAVPIADLYMPRVVLPRTLTSYKCNSPIRIRRPCIFEGVALGNINGSRLVFPIGTSGVIIDGPFSATEGPGAASPGARGDGSIVRNMFIGTITQAPVWLPSHVYNVGDYARPTQILNNRTGFIYRVTIGGTSGVTEPTWTTAMTQPVWPAVTGAAFIDGDGIQWTLVYTVGLRVLYTANAAHLEIDSFCDGVVLYGDPSGTPISNTNICSISSIVVQLCERDGFHVEGGSANANHFERCSAISCGVHGFNDISDLGNSYYSMHTDACGIFGVTSLEPSPYRAVNGNGVTGFYGSYTEAGQPTLKGGVHYSPQGAPVEDSANFPQIYSVFSGPQHLVRNKRLPVVSDITINKSPTAFELLEWVDGQSAETYHWGRGVAGQDLYGTFAMYNNLGTINMALPGKLALHNDGRMQFPNGIQLGRDTGAPVVITSDVGILDDGRLVQQGDRYERYDATENNFATHVCVRSGRAVPFWEPGTIYAKHTIVKPTSDVTYPFYVICTTAGTSGAVEPVWAGNQTPQVDGTAQWSTGAGHNPSVTGIQEWLAATVYTQGQTVFDWNTGGIFQVVIGGTSGGVEPSWVQTYYGVFTIDNTITWRYYNQGYYSARFVKTGYLSNSSGPQAVNVKDFGATGLGVADDAPAINAAIQSLDPDTGGVVFFPIGVYRVSSPIEADRTCILQGSGGGRFYSGTKIAADLGVIGIWAMSSGEDDAGYGFSQGSIRDLAVTQASVVSDSHASITSENVSHVGSTDTITINIPADESKFANNDVVRLWGAGFQSTVHNLLIDTVATSADVIITTNLGIPETINGLYIGQHLIIGTAFPTATRIINIVGSTVTMATTAATTLTGSTFDYFQDVWGRIESGGGTDTLVIDFPYNGSRTIVSGGRLTKAAPGILCKSVSSIYNVTVHDVQGPGILWRGSQTETPDSNVNVWHMQNIFTLNCLHGMYVNGENANAGSTLNFNGAGNRLYTIDDDSLLGNTYEGSHASGAYAYRSRDNANCRVLLSGNYTEVGGYVGMGLGSLVTGGTMPVNPGCPSFVSGIMSAHQVGSLLYTKYQWDWRVDDITLAAFEHADGETQYIRRTAAGDGNAPGWWAFDSGASLASGISIMWSDADYDRGGDAGGGFAWIPHGLYLGGDVFNGTINQTGARRYSATNGEPTQDLLAEIGDFWFNTAPTEDTPGDPWAFRCIGFDEGDEPIWQPLYSVSPGVAITDLAVSVGTLFTIEDSTEVLKYLNITSTGTQSFLSGDATGSAIAFDFNTQNLLSTSTDYLLKVRNNDTEYFSIDYFGDLRIRQGAWLWTNIASGSYIEMQSTTITLGPNQNPEFVAAVGSFYPNENLGASFGKSDRIASEVWTRTTAGVVKTVTFSATPTFDADDGKLSVITLTAAVTSWTIANGLPAQEIKIRFLQDGTGTWTVGAPTGNVILAGGAYTNTLTANKSDILTFIWDGSNWLETARSVNV